MDNFKLDPEDTVIAQLIIDDDSFHKISDRIDVDDFASRLSFFFLLMYRHHYCYFLAKAALA